MDSQDYQTIENAMDDAIDNLSEILLHVKFNDLDADEEQSLHKILLLAKKIELESYKRRS